MSSQRWMLSVCFSLLTVFGTGESMATSESRKYTCRTFGSGVVQPFNGSAFYLRSNCQIILTRFTHNRVECDVTVRRGDSGLLAQIEIIINKVRTVIRNGSIQVEKKSVSLPYDHTYQHVFHYGIYTRLRSSLLPLSVTWHDVPGGADTLWVELDQEPSSDMTGLCGRHNMSGSNQQLTAESILAEDTCQTRDPVHADNLVCRQFFSHAMTCLGAQRDPYFYLCLENIYGHESNKYISCAFFKEIALQCGNSSYLWNKWRSVTECAPPTCPGELVYVEQGDAFVRSCSNVNPRSCRQEITSSCVCPAGTVLNDHVDGFSCVNASSCPCVFNDRSYSTGEIRSTKCQSCQCDGGRWRCSENSCPPKCVIEGQFVTTFDGKHYAIPRKCRYMASQGLDWTIKIEFSDNEASVRAVVLQIFQETYTFTRNMVKLGEEDITELHQSDHTLVFWESSMYVQVHTSLGMKIQVQVFPEIQLYITPPRNHTGMISGLCGNNNNDSTDDFTTSSGIIENSAKLFASSWTSCDCTGDIRSPCINTGNEIFADEKCSVLNEPNGIFAKCHGYIPTDQYHTACIQRTCNCGNNLQQCLCVALGNYAKACADLGVELGDWRKTGNCTLNCPKNQEFSYETRACNRTCGSLSGPDPRCELEDGPVEGCGCPEGTHLNQEDVCTPKAQCLCHHRGGPKPPGPVVIDGRQCLCEDGKLHCSEDCGCRNGKVCVHYSDYPVNTAHKTCDSLSKPLRSNMTCVSGCHCPHDQYEDHRGNCVSRDNCTCVYSGRVFGAGRHVKTNCKTCVCGQGQWRCTGEPCPGTCQVYGNGHYQTFDSKWYRFDGHCQYTLVEDHSGTFSIRVETVPCCDEALTCSRSIILDLEGEVTLTLSDMKVTRRLQNGWSVESDLLYSTHSVGLYIIITVPSKGLSLIWDKHTRISVELQPYWRNKVGGLCGNFDSNEMNDLQIKGSAVMSSPLAFGNSWKAATPPCCDVTTEIFPCERNSYCSAWAQRRCMILKGATFIDCHYKVDPEPYYQACVQESCSCEFEGKFLGFCTAVAAYAEACSDQDVCINWRTPDLCPVYCDYYNEQGQCSWHYEPCGGMLTCGKDSYFTRKLEGCYPRCPEEASYYDENTGGCTTLRNCSCYFNDTVVPAGKVVIINSIWCICENGTINCRLPTPTPTTPFTTATTSSFTSMTITPNTTIPTSTPTSTSKYYLSTFTTMPPASSAPTTYVYPTTTEGCYCIDLKMKKSWSCGETWIEDCFEKLCKYGKIELTPVVCPESAIPSCPRDLTVKVTDGCCETWTCDCRCELYGDPHYISFQGVNFDFLEECSYILVEERSPRYHLIIAVENVNCVPGFNGSCATGIILKYQNNTATLRIHNFIGVQATLNNETIQPPYEEAGLRFETTGYEVFVHLPDIRSFVSLTPSYTAVVSVAMEHFLNNTQGQCGECGGASCVRRGGQIEDDTCCDKTAYDWVYADPLKPACSPKSVPCGAGPSSAPLPRCLPNPLCELLHHHVFANCSKHVNLTLIKKNCEFDACRNLNASCSSLEQAAEMCKPPCIDWRGLTNGSCDVQCPEGLVYKEGQNKLDDFCYGGVRQPGAPLVKMRAGCFCPNGLLRAGNHSNVCVNDCNFCKGALGEPRLPGEVWWSNCHMCTCNNQTCTEECVPSNAVPKAFRGRYGDCNPTCVNTTCSLDGKTYMVGDRWRDVSRPCRSLSCTSEGLQIETKVCPTQDCSEDDRVWDEQHCCFTCKSVQYRHLPGNQTCAPKLSSFPVTMDNCTAVIEMPVCEGVCASRSRVVVRGCLRVEQDYRSCMEHGSEMKSVTLHCSDLTTRQHTIRHITSCVCRGCDTS